MIIKEGLMREDSIFLLLIGGWILCYYLAVLLKRIYLYQYHKLTKICIKFTDCRLPQEDRLIYIFCPLVVMALDAHDHREALKSLKQEQPVCIHK